MILSVLDQSPIAEGTSFRDALVNSVDLARLAERLGFERYWVAEHHGTTMLAGTSPEILIAHIASATSRMRVGSGGVMLPHYSPLKVAETFSMLNAFHPGRIDLAIGRAAGTDPLTAFALQRDRRLPAPDDFREQLAELLAHMRDGFPPGHHFARLRQSRAAACAPDLWLLGSSPQSAIWAAEVGLPYAFADFINSNGSGIAHRYRESFAPSATLASPRVSVAVWALCADTHEEAERLASSSRLGFLRFLSGEPGPSLPSKRRWPSCASIPRASPRSRSVDARLSATRRSCAPAWKRSLPSTGRMKS